MRSSRGPGAPGNPSGDLGSSGTRRGPAVAIARNEEEPPREPSRGARNQGPGGSPFPGTTKPRHRREDPKPTAVAGQPPDPVPLPGGLWICQEPGHRVTVGLTQELQSQVGRVTRFRGPVPGTFHRQGEPLVSLESEKWVGHQPNPLDGTVVEVHEAWYHDPSALGSCPWKEAWFYRLLPQTSARALAASPLLEGGSPKA